MGDACIRLYTAMVLDQPTASSLSGVLSEFAASVSASALPFEVVDKVKALVLHGTTSALAGSSHPHARSIVDLIKREERTTSGSTIIADGARVTKGGAAFASSELIHRGGRLDIYRMLTHPGTTILPAAIVAAEANHRNGSDFIAAVAAGYEVQARLSRGWVPYVQARGFRSSPVFGIFGAVVAAGLLSHLDVSQINSALSLGVELASGNLEGARTASQSISIHEPSASRNAILAVLLAEEGVSGSETSFEGPAGFYHAYAGANGEKTRPLVDHVIEDLGSSWEILETAFRIYAIAGFNQQVVQVAASASSENDLVPEEIESVELTMSTEEVFYPSPEFPQDPERLEPRRGGPQYYCAWGLIDRGYPVLRGRPLPGEMPTDEPNGVMELTEKVTLRPTPGHSVFQPTIIIQTTDGRRIEQSATGDEFKFDFAEEQRRMKEVIPVLPISESKYGELVQTIAGLQNLTSISDLIQLTIPGK